MYNIFCNCSTLKKLNLSNFNTNNVTNMSFMFDGVNWKKCKLECEDAKILKKFS